MNDIMSYRSEKRRKSKKASKAPKKKTKQKKRGKYQALSPKAITFKAIRKRRLSKNRSSRKKPRRVNEDGVKHFVYLIRGERNYSTGLRKVTAECTYWGYSVNPRRRLRQHNRETKGGAKKTGKASNWKHILVISGFKTERDALQFEWKQNRARNMESLEKRLTYLDATLKLPRMTNSAKLISEMKLTINWLDDYKEKRHRFKHPYVTHNCVNEEFIDKIHI